MSLINDVLRDLERRRNDGVADLPPASPAPSRRRRPIGAWTALVASAIVVGVVLHWSLGREAVVTPESGQPLTAMVGDADRMTESPRASDDLTARPDADTARATSDPDPIPMDSGPADPEPAPPVEAAATDQAQSTRPVDRQSVETSEPNPVRSSPESIAVPERPEKETGEPAAPTDADADRESITIRRANQATASDDPMDAARRMIARGQTARARSRLTDLLDADPGHVEARELLARLHIQAGRTEAAARTLQEGLTQAAEPAPLAALLGRLRLEQGRVADAVSVLARHIDSSNDDADYALLLGAAYRQAGEHDSAAATYRSLSRREPALGAAWIGLGASMESLDQPAEAITAYREALESNDIRARQFARERLEALEPRNGDTP